MKLSIATPQKALPLWEYVVLLAALFSLVAFSIDSLLPALPQIASDFVPDDVNRAQLLISAFVIGSGVGQLIFGPLSDTIGRRMSLTVGMLLYMTAAFLALWAQTLETILFWRFVQGLGAAGPRACGMAMTRDLYSGRQMAKVNSMAFTFFVLVPAVAPLIGQGVIMSFGWRHMFTTYMLLALIILIWFLTRQPETLARENRRPLSARPLAEAFMTVITNRIAIIYMMVITLAFAQLIAFISSAQQIFVDTLQLGTRFPLYFAGITIISAASGMLNSRLVLRLGMRRLAHTAFASQTVVAALMVFYWSMRAPTGSEATFVFCLWATTLFFMNGLSFGNLNALAIQPLGHIAGMASAIIGSVPTIAAMLIAAPIGLAFDGTPMPLLIGVLLCSSFAVIIMSFDAQNDS